MAKVTPGPIVIDARGKLADVVFSRRRGTSYTRRWLIPHNPKSRDQTAWRTAYTNLFTHWQTVTTDAQRRAWNEFAKTQRHPIPISAPVHTSGWNEFLLWNIYLLQIASTINNDPPTSLAKDETLRVQIVTNTASPQDLTVNLTSSVSDPDNWNAIVFSCPPVLATHYWWNNMKRWVNAYPYGSGRNITSDWADVMNHIPIPSGTLIAGKRITVAARSINLNTGALGHFYFDQSLTA